MRWQHRMIVRIPSTDSSNRTVAFANQFAALTTAMRSEEGSTPPASSSSATTKENKVPVKAC